MSLPVHQFPGLEDNYGALVRDDVSGEVACIDPPEAGPVLEALREAGWSLDIILNTHWHSDHVGGNVMLRAKTGASIFAPEEVTRVTRVDEVVGPGDRIELGASSFEVIDTGGHTGQHLSYHVPSSAALFIGDTLFAMGCGRIFEGTATQMWASLQRLTALPPATLIYCAHEYSAANCRFALTQDRSPAVRRRCRQLFRDRADERSTVPTTIAAECETNPFLRAPMLRRQLDAVSAFAAMRRDKDDFRG